MVTARVPWARRFTFGSASYLLSRHFAVDLKLDFPEVSASNNSNADWPLNWIDKVPSSFIVADSKAVAAVISPNNFLTEGG